MHCKGWVSLRGLYAIEGSLQGKKKKKSMPVNVTSQNYGKDEIERVLAAAKV